MSNTFSIENFKKALKFGGARPNKFMITGLTPLFDDNSDQVLLVKAAQLPASRITPIPVPFRGRQVQVAGDRIFDPWTVTVINDGNMEIRRKCEAWMSTINAHAAGTAQSSEMSNYHNFDATVHQLSLTGETLYKYKFAQVWPSDISQIELSYDAESQIEQYDITFQVTYWTSAGTDGNNSGSDGFGDNTTFA